MVDQEPCYLYVVLTMILCSTNFSEAHFSFRLPNRVSRNKFVEWFENEVGPGVLLYNVLQTYNLQNYHTLVAESTHNRLHLVCGFGILAVLAFVGCWAGALQFRSRFQTAQIV